MKLTKEELDLLGSCMVIARQQLAADRQKLIMVLNLEESLAKLLQYVENLDDDGAGSQEPDSDR